MNKLLNFTHSFLLTIWIKLIKNTRTKLRCGNRHLSSSTVHAEMTQNGGIRVKPLSLFVASFLVKLATELMYRYLFPV